MARPPPRNNQDNNNSNNSNVGVPGVEGHQTQPANDSTNATINGGSSSPAVISNNSNINDFIGGNTGGTSMPAQNSNIVGVNSTTLNAS
ncbi:hypothetical protein A2U01_0050466, partial [Trifolium medium]|nr:hypothetical protein [Trifolium medium]